MTILKRIQPLLDSFVEIGVDTNNTDANDIINQSFNQIKKIEQLLNEHDPDSDLSRLNRYGHKGVELDPVTADVLRLALHITGISGGDFNCTKGGSLIKKGILPNHGGRYPLSVGTADDVVLSGCRATLSRPVCITLAGIAKGYAMDQAVNRLKQGGIESGWVNAGGDLRLFGDISIPIYQRQLDDKVQLLGEFMDTAIATPSTTIDSENRIPSFVLDGNGNYDNKNNGVWTVKASLSWLANALTQIVGTNPSQQVKEKISLLGGELFTATVL